MTGQRQSSTNQLLRESKLVTALSLIGLICLLSGVAISLFKTQFSIWMQWNVVAHSIAGASAILPFILYSFLHFRRTVGIRKAGILFTGLVATIVFLAVFGTGLWLVTIGQEEAHPWVSPSHSILSYLVASLTLLHVMLHWRNRNNRNRKKEGTFITVSRPALLKTSGYGITIYLLAISALSLAYMSLYQPPSLQVPPDYQSSYGTHPFRPSLTETSNQSLVHESQIAKSQQCGACHTEIYDEWVSSAHRQAASDPAYVKNITLLEQNKGIAATRYCEGCHAPVALLTGQLTEGGKHGGVPNTKAHLEGVGCMGCHGIESVVSLAGTASYKFSAKEHYLFDSSESLLGQKIRNFLIQASPYKHKIAMGADVLGDPKLCATCHEQFMDKSMNDWGWVKMQSTYQGWLASPFSGQNDQTHGDTTTMRCQDCHFPKISSTDPSADKFGLVSSHRSLGANTVLPTLNGDTEQFELTKQFLQSSKMLLNIDKPAPRSNVSNDQFVDQSLKPSKHDTLPYFLYLGETGTLSVNVINRLVGHNFPAGTNDINQAWLFFNVKDGNGRSVFVSGDLNRNLELDPKAHTYHSVPVDRHGKEVWKHDLFRMTGEVYKNVIPSGKSDIRTYKFSVPSWAKSPLTVEAILRYRKFNQRYARWALDAERPEIPVIDMARDTLTIPLRRRQKASAVSYQEQK